MGLPLFSLVYYYIYILITSYWSQKRPTFTSYEAIQSWAVLVKVVWTKFAQVFRWIKNGSNVLLLGLFLYLYPYHFILIPKKANIHFVRSYSKLGSFGQSSLDEVSVALIMGLTIWELFNNYIYTFITLYWYKKWPVFILKALNLNLNLHTNLLKVWTIFVVEVCTSFPLDKKWV